MSQRIDHFNGSTAEYISHLEHKVLALQKELDTLSLRQSREPLPTPYSQTLPLGSQLPPSSSLLWLSDPGPPSRPHFDCRPAPQHPFTHPFSEHPPSLEYPPSSEHPPFSGHQRSQASNQSFCYQQSQAFGPSPHHYQSFCYQQSQALGPSPHHYQSSQPSSDRFRSLQLLQEKQKTLEIIPYTGDGEPSQESSSVDAPLRSKRNCWQREIESVFCSISQEDKSISTDEVLCIISLFALDEASALTPSPIPFKSFEPAQTDFENLFVKRIGDLYRDGEVKTRASHFGTLVYDSWSYVQVILGINNASVIDPRMKKVHAHDAALRKGELVDTPRTWQRFRKGALWVNQLISDLEAELGLQATKLFIRYAQNPERYVRFSEAKESATFFKGRMRTVLESGTVGKENNFLISIPFLVKQLAGDKCSLLQICNTLKYKPAHISSIQNLGETSLEQLETFRRLLLDQLGGPQNLLEGGPQPLIEGGHQNLTASTSGNAESQLDAVVIVNGQSSTLIDSTFAMSPGPQALHENLNSPGYWGPVFYQLDDFPNFDSPPAHLDDLRYFT